jgi:hypothetical protein
MIFEMTVLSSCLGIRLGCQREKRVVTGAGEPVMLVILSLQGVDEKLREYVGLIFEEFLQAAHVPCNCIWYCKYLGY